MRNRRSSAMRNCGLDIRSSMLVGSVVNARPAKGPPLRAAALGMQV